MSDQRTADTLAAWLADATEEEQTALVAHFSALSLLSIRLLFSALADAEVVLYSPELLRAVQGYLAVEDKRCALAAAGCLLACGGAYGRILVREAIHRSTLPSPHARLIQAMCGYSF